MAYNIKFCFTKNKIDKVGNVERQQKTKINGKRQQTMKSGGKAW